MSEYEQAQYMNTFMQYIPPASASLPESCTVSTNAKFITRTPSQLAGKKKAQKQRSREPLDQLQCKNLVECNPKFRKQLKAKY